MKRKIEIARGSETEWWGNGPKPLLGTPKYLAARETYELRLDKKFRTQFSPSAIARLMNETRVFLEGRGWADVGQYFKRAGIALDSVQGAHEDRPAFLALQSLIVARKVSVLLTGASQDLVRSMRIAWTHGTWLAEFELSVMATRLAGRKKRGETYVAKLTELEASWKRANPTIDRLPTAKELYQRFVGAFPQSIGLDRFQLYFTQMRKAQAKVVENRKPTKLWRQKQGPPQL